MGAVVIEKHLTLDKSQKGSDHAFSLLPEECLELRKRLEQIDEFMGIKFPEDSIEDHQQDARYKLGKSAVSKKHRNKGETIQEEDVCYVSPAAGLTPAHFSSYIGKSLVQEIKMGDYFTHLHFAAFKSEDYFS
jgi:sialic acid synthase SpsE